MNIESLLQNEAIKEFGAGVLIGFTLGYTFKHVFKFFVLLLGLYLIGLIYLSNKGVVQVDWQSLQSWVNYLFQGFKNFMESIKAPVASLGGFTVGFALGMKF
ncbi:FUN14 domain-containing protein [Aquifex sp.]